MTGIQSVEMALMAVVDVGIIPVVIPFVEVAVLPYGVRMELLKLFGNLLREVILNVEYISRGKNVDKDGKPIYLPDLVRRVMESVIRYRVQTQKPLWITSNTDPKFVAEVFSEDIASLLNEAVIAVCVRGSDYRKRIQKENKESLL